MNFKIGDTITRKVGTGRTLQIHSISSGFYRFADGRLLEKTYAHEHYELVDEWAPVNSKWVRDKISVIVLTHTVDDRVVLERASDGAILLVPRELFNKHYEPEAVLVPRHLIDAALKVLAPSTELYQDLRDVLR